MGNVLRKTGLAMLALAVIISMCSVFAGDAYAASKPAQVKGVKAVSITADSCTVKWSKVKGATSYKVYRAESKNGTYKLVKTTSSLSFKNTKLKPCKTYYYKVQAYNKKVKGKASAVKSVKTASKYSNLKAPSYYKEQEGNIYLNYGYITGLEASELAVNDIGDMTYYYSYADAEKAKAAFEKYEKYLADRQWAKETPEDEEVTAGDFYVFTDEDEEEYTIQIVLDEERCQVWVCYYNADYDKEADDDDDQGEDNDDQGEDEQ